MLTYFHYFKITEVRSHWKRGATTQAGGDKELALGIEGGLAKSRTSIFEKGKWANVSQAGLEVFLADYAILIDVHVLCMSQELLISFSLLNLGFQEFCELIHCNGRSIQWQPLDQASYIDLVGLKEEGKSLYNRLEWSVLSVPKSCHPIHKFNICYLIIIVLLELTGEFQKLFICELWTCYPF